jgi:hypothetical protein
MAQFVTNSVVFSNVEIFKSMGVQIYRNKGLGPHTRPLMPALPQAFYPTLNNLRENH